MCPVRRSILPLRWTARLSVSTAGRVLALLTVFPCTVTVLLPSDAVSVSVFWKKGTAAVLNRTDRMSVVKDEGGQVWLADRSGSGYVIKK